MYIGIRIAQNLFFDYDVLRYLDCRYMLQSLHLIYAHSFMLLYAHKCLHTMKVMAVEQVL